jgi:hypothetical protein
LPCGVAFSGFKVIADRQHFLICRAPVAQEKTGLASKVAMLLVSATLANAVVSVTAPPKECATR